MAIVTTDDKHYYAISDRIRFLTDTTETYKPSEMPQGVQDVYDVAYEKGKSEADTDEAYNQGVEAGKKAQYDEFWDTYQENGTRTNYQFAFGGRGWKKTNLKPKYDVKPVNAANMFAETETQKWVTTQSDELIDLYEIEQEQGIVFDFTNCTIIHSCFRGCAIKRINTINLANVKDLTYIFYQAQYLERIEHLILHGLTYSVNSRPFEGLPKLTYIGFEGQIDGNNWNLSQCTKLEKQCLIAFMNCLVDKTTDTSGTSWAITLGATNLAKLTDEEKAIATEKGWTLA